MMSIVRKIAYAAIIIFVFPIAICTIYCIYLHNFCLRKIIESSISTKSINISIKNLRFNYFTGNMRIGEVKACINNRTACIATIEQANVKIISLLNMEFCLNLQKCCILSSNFVKCRIRIRLIIINTQENKSQILRRYINAINQNLYSFFSNSITIKADT